MNNVNLPLNHPLRKARWIWPGSNIYLHNNFARFRHDFAVPAIPESAPLFITADKAYKLYINGQYVCRGPARGYQSHWPFDEIDVHQYLQQGHNWISVEAYNPGISTFQYLHMGRAAFLCAAEWDGVAIYTDEWNGNWKFGRSPGHAVNTAMLTVQMEFQEDFNTTLDNRSWIYSADFKDSLISESSWPCEGNGMPFGQPPYDTVEPREIPMLSEEIIVPEKLLVYNKGVSEKGYSTCPNITWHFCEKELPKIKEWCNASELKSNKTTDSLEIEMPVTGTGHFTAVTIDLGQNTPGTQIVEVQGATGNEIIDFHNLQYIVDRQPVFVKPSGALIAISNRLRLTQGSCQHEFFHITGVRHVVMVVRDASTPLKIKLSWRTALYPFKMQGAFKCSDETLNQIHAICRHTQRVCSIDAYIDTPWREQGQWWGDARIQIRNTIYLDGDMRLAARGHTFNRRTKCSIWIDLWRGSGM